MDEETKIAIANLQSTMQWIKDYLRKTTNHNERNTQHVKDELRDIGYKLYNIDHLL